MHKVCGLCAPAGDHSRRRLPQRQAADPRGRFSSTQGSPHSLGSSGMIGQHVESLDLRGLTSQLRHLAYDSFGFATLVTEDDLDIALSAAAAADRLLVVGYYAHWCRACHKLLSQVHKMTDEDEALRGVLFASVDFEQSRALGKARSLKKLPTLEIYRDRELRQQWTGGSKQKLLTQLDEELQATAGGRAVLVATDAR